MSAAVVPLAAAVGRIALGALFVWAGLLKLGNPAEFADNLANYQMLPSALIPWVAVAMPGVELAVGIALLVGLCTRASAALACTMLTGFIFAVAVALARGLNIECGCFGGGSTVDVGLLVRDLFMLAAGILVLVGDRGYLRLNPFWVRSGTS